MLQGDLQQPTEGLVAISRDRAEGILKRWLRDEGVLDAPTKAKEWLEDLLEHHLLQVAAKPKEIEFHHQLFQEYYAGRALLKLLVERHQDAINDERLQHFYLNYFKWTEPLAFMLSLLGDEVQAVRVVRLALEVDVMLGARLAGEVQREFQKQTVGLVDGSNVPWWLKVGLLAEVRSDEAIPGLLKFVEDSDSDVCRRAVDALGAIGSEAAIHELLKLVEYSDRKMRWRVADALGKIGSEAAIPALLKLLKDSNTNVRWRAADALRQIGTEAAIPESLKLVEDSNSDVRQSAANALGQIGAEAAIPALLKLAEDSDSYVRWTTAKALGKIGSKVAISGLLKLSEDSEFYVRFSVAKALGNIGTEATIPGLLKLSKDLDTNVRLIATKALEKIHDNGELPKFFKLFEDSNSDVYMTVEDELEKMGFEVSILELLKIIECSDFYVRSKAAVALGKIGSEKAISGLLKLVEDSELYVRRKAIDAIANIAKQHTEKVASHLPHLLTLIPSESGTEVHRLILAIQAACKYYNYTIRQLSLTPEASKIKDSAGLIINGNVGNLNTGTVNVKSDQVGTQHNIYPKN